MPKYHVSISGTGRVKQRLGKRGANKLRSRVGLILEEGVYDMAEDSYQMAPKDTTALAQSILASVEKEAPLTWYYGSTMPYAQRQEYEHKTRRGYFRRSIMQNKPIIYERIEHSISKTFN